MPSIADIPNLTKLMFKGFAGKEIGFSFNVAERCPIGCSCYWRERLERMEAAGKPIAELEDEAAIGFFEDMNARGYLLVTLVGGEPYVRPKLLQKLTPIMRQNWLVTSGTSPLRRFPKTMHFISIDGKDAETHNTIRKSKNLFERIERNLAKVRAEGAFPAVGHSVLNGVNYRQIGDIMKYWAGNGLLDGFAFSTMTPVTGAEDDHLRLSQSQREWIVEELLRQKKVFGTYLINTEAMIELFHPEVTASQRPDTCGTARRVASFDGAGDRIGQCILGENADCTQCGCVITSMVDTLFSRHAPGTIKMLRTLRVR